jgi:polyribonucleotide nucleotidyltransferase
MGCKFEIELNNQLEIYDIGNIARQASGSVMLRIKNAVVLAAVARDDRQVEEDFLPLTVQYIEKSYAAGKIPGGYIKRETKPGDFETLTSRLVDRSLRPLFPKGYAYPTQITILVLSSDKDIDLQVMALNAASAALYVSDIPVNKSVCGVRVAKLDGEFVLNPTAEQMANSSLDLFVSGTKDELLMIEMRSISTVETEVVETAAVDPMMDPTLGQNLITVQKANELSEEETIKALEFATEAIKEASALYGQTFERMKKEDANLEYKEENINESLFTYIDEFYKEEVYEAINKMAKSERAVELEKIAKNILNDETAQKEGWDYELVLNVIDRYKRKAVREMIINEEKRADGRGLRDVRPITIETNILPSVHGSCLFTRGQTQALVTCTIGSDQDAQMYDLLTEKGPKYEKFMVHYNFPGFSVGEASPMRAPGRRELGHGNLAKRALEPLIDKEQPNTIRLVSDILESNGSSSMATVCGGSLALNAAGISTEKLVAGVAMGLVIEGEKSAILTDIMGLEDHDGDMDFKVAGTRDGITALQMDIKLGGIDRQTLKDALLQASQARNHILDIMEEAKEKIVVNEEMLPSLERFLVHPSKIVDIIGQAGKTIKEIIEKFEVSIDLDREKGEVKVAGKSKAKVKAACDHIKTLTSKDNRRGAYKREVPEFDKNRVYKGKVKKIVEFGAFVELPGNIDGLLHISKILKDKSGNINDVLNEGDELNVVVLSQKGHKIELAFEGASTRD